MRILVTGSREFAAAKIVAAALTRAAGPVARRRPTLVHGGARGADTLASDIAWRWGWAIERHPANWTLHGAAAGVIRNQEMVDAGADVCLAFQHRGAGNVGTNDCMRRAGAAGVPVRVYWSDGAEGQGDHADPAGLPAGSAAPGMAQP